ncbi:MAG: electron transfer flavoprotein subunit alpha/FixB family protein [Dehalococcoidia bacterium]|nr:electron transfer flavoprotein subunit alpha/FixB family protein [Dehalococcoidia bacterium]
MTKSLYGAQEASAIWVYLEQNQGRLTGVSLELVGKARELTDGRSIPLVGVLLGDQVSGLAQEAIAAGADEVRVADHPLLRQYTTDGYTKAFTELILAGKPDILLLGATPNGRDLAGRLAVRLRTGLTADCTDLRLEEDTGLLVGEVTGFGGGILAYIKCPDNRPQMATVRPGVFAVPAPDGARQGKVVSVPVNLAKEDIKVQVLEHVDGQGVDITRAQVLVAAGRGCQGDLALINELASLLDGEVGVSRVPVDEGWASRDRMIGQTGYVTRPKLAIVCGISGAFQFSVGIEKAETIVAINTDAEAPIFEQADYCIVDDMFDVLPPLIEAVKRARGGNGGR